jgi:hypothetical protein
MAAASRRLRLYTDHRLVQTWVREKTLPNRYTLTTKGEAWVGNSDPRFVYRTRVRGDSDSAAHMVATADVWASLSRRLGRLGSAFHFTTEAEVRRMLPVLRGALIPDGILTIGADVTLSLEVDLGTERTEILASKFKKYHPHLMGETPLLGFNLAAMVVVAPSLRRLAQLALIAHDARIQSRVLFGRLGDTTDVAVLDRLATFDSIARLAEAPATQDPFTHSLLENLA